MYLTQPTYHQKIVKVEIGVLGAGVCILKLFRKRSINNILVWKYYFLFLSIVFCFQRGKPHTSSSGLQTYFLHVILLLPIATESQGTF